MPKNKKESFIFTLMMCTIMVLVMSFYNVIRIHGMTEHVMLDTIKSFPLAFVIAFTADWVIVGHIAKRVAFRIIKPEDPMIKKAIIISSFMVIGMVIIMSLFGAFMCSGFSMNIFAVWMMNIPMNFIVAYPLQILIAGPIVRFGFGKICAA